MKSLSPSFIEKLRFNENGLIPAIAQDWLDGAILMLAWMNRASLEETLKTKEVHYWSRTKKQLWHKGATSGNTQKLKGIRFDCDADALLLTIEQTGIGACHKGKRSCFFNNAAEEYLQDEISQLPPMDSCSELFKIIAHRQSFPDHGSYTNKLLDGGDNLILKKIGEESVEFVMACKDDNAESIANEAADLLFHLQVALASHDVKWQEVLKVLENRKGAPRRQ